VSLELAECYAVCRGIARKEAKNFYYAFLALPRAKRNAICAVYAFMRHADDLSDDESKPHAQRRLELDEWLAQWHAAQRGEATLDPVFIALRDTAQRFSIPAELLDQLVAGTTMDLDLEAAPGRLDTYETFAELYRYCYLVASVVGLVCIRIFGYSDRAAEKLAEETGIAFQLTNILRDVREDASRGRVYLPIEDLSRFGTSAEELATVNCGSAIKQQHRELLQFEASRAHQYYKSAQKMLPLLSPDSRPAMWVLVAIYSRLLDLMEADNFDVFSTRIKVPTHEKLWILTQGFGRMVLQGFSG
jgi:15-cis-phytoene synthase